MFHVEQRRLRLLVVVLVGAVTVFLWPPRAGAAVPRISSTGAGARHAAGIVLVEPKDGVDAQTVATSVGAQGIVALPRIGVVKLRVPSGQEETLAERLRRSGLVKRASPDYLRSIATIPNDPDYSQQWALPRIDAPEAWQTTLGDARVTIAVIDTGYDFTHPDRPIHLVAGPTLTSNALQDGCPSAATSTPQDDNGHGTHVGGIIAAAFDNGVGVAGLAPNVSLLVIKAADCVGTLADSDVAQALHFAADAGAAIVNMSFGGPEDDPILDDAVQYAAERGVILVAAAGNLSSGAPFYPAWLPGVTAVSATDSSDAFASWFSNYGPDIAVAAPGVGVLSTIPGGYGYKTGTSMATPHVSAVAGLVRSAAPGLTASQVVQAIERGADQMGPGCPNVYYGYGRVNAAGAILAATTMATAQRAASESLTFRVFLPLVVNQHCGL